MANIILKCAVCGTPLVDDICPQCGYVQIYFPSSVPKAISDFQKKRVEVLTDVTKRHSDQLEEANRGTVAAQKEAEKLRADLFRANDTIKTQKDELADKDSELKKKEREIADLKNKLRDAEKKSLNPQLPFGFMVSPNKDFIGTLNDRGERTMGVSKNSKGEFYMGDWKLDLQTGVGIRVDQTGKKYAGQFRMDRANGVGVMINSDGTGFAGEWKNGRKSGGGMTAKPNGEKMFARYEGDIVRTALGAYFLQDGSVICGHMTELGPTGKCICYRTDGSVEEETWRNGIKI